ncbi:MAG: universal stress protein [Bacteroidetes bacterium]|nr:MAG: universal stress protein [Bacteroidota bacterium]
MKKILFPTDFSPAAQNAFEYAMKLAADLDAKVDLLSVYSLPFADSGSIPPEYINTMLEEKEKNVRKKLEDFTQGFHNGNLGELITKYGIFVYQDVIDLAREGNYDLIVMGTKGERSAFEKILGSVTTHTMMNAPCPVLAVPKSSRYKTIENIAYATDFVPKDQAAVQQLAKFAERLGAKIHFVHVETDPDLGRLEDYVEIEKYPFEFSDFTLLNEHSVVEGMDEFIDRKKIDVLALFIPKRSLWERLFHRSFTKQMTFHAKTPLLVFHE